MAIDIPSIQAEIKSEQITTEKAIGGITNMSGWRDLDDQGKEDVDTLLDKYTKWRGVWERLNVALLELIALGYPTQPTIDVPPSMLVIIARELSEDAFASTLFIAKGTATKMQATVSEPRKQ